MTTSAAVTPAFLREATSSTLRPRYEGSNICTWIGFKHVNYLVEEAVLDHLRAHGLPAGRLYETQGLGTDVVGIDTRILHALHIDDLVTADVTPGGVRDGELAFTVKLAVQRDAKPVHAATSKVRVVLRADRGAPPVPEELATFTTPRISRAAAKAPVPLAAGTDLAAGRNAFVWTWRIPYFYCHFTERIQMSGYLRVMEEVVDLFLADRGVSIKRLLDEQDWIPVVPHSSVTMLGEALMEEELHTVFTVEDVFKNFTYTSRMDTYVERDGMLVPTSTGRITHGYAVIDNRRDWRLVDFDDRLSGALRGDSDPRT